jgi:hypothetical protein
VPKAYGRNEVLRPYLADKLGRSARLARSAYNRLEFEDNSLPLDSARIVFRDITRATDSRTVIACLLPPGTAAMEKAPVIVQRQGGASETAALLGVMASMPFDWYLRRWVELKLSFELLNASPVPIVDTASQWGARVVELAARLAAVDDRYASWAADVGVPVGSVASTAEKEDSVAELDALVGLLYGLSEDQMEHIFLTFQRGTDYRSRFTSVLEHYREWKGRE